MKDEFEELYNPVGVARTWHEWATDNQIRRLSGFLRDDVFVRTEMSMIYGQGGSGKSYLTMYIGICVAMGLPVYNMPTKKGRVLFLSEEMPHQVIHARCRTMLREDSAKEMGENFSIACQLGFDFSDQIILSQRKLEKIIKETKSELVFIDALADIHTASENDNSEMGKVMKSIRAVARSTGACIVVIHHMGKPGLDGETRGARGASVMKDACETQMEVRPIGKSGEPRSLVQFKKTRHVIGRIPGSFEFAQEEDPERQVNVAGDGEPSLIKPGVIFTVSGHKDRSITDTMIRMVRDIVAELAKGYEDHQVPSPVLMDRMVQDGASKKKVIEAVQRAVSVGLIVRLAGGRKLCIPES